MNSKYLIIATLTIFMIAVSGCTSPAPTASPSPSPLATAAATALPTAVPPVTPTPVPTAAPTPVPTPVPVYTNSSPISASNIKIDWDTTQYEGAAKETASMTVKNTLSDAIVSDVVVSFKVTTPTTFMNPDGTIDNRTNTITKQANIGLMQAGDSKDLTFQVDHLKNVPVTVSIVIEWRGGSAIVFKKALDLPDHKFGTYKF